MNVLMNPYMAVLPDLFVLLDWFYEAVFGFVTRLGFRTFVRVAESDADNHLVAFAETKFLLNGLDCLAGRIFW